MVQASTTSFCDKLQNFFDETHHNLNGIKNFSIKQFCDFLNFLVENSEENQIKKEIQDLTSQILIEGVKSGEITDETVKTLVAQTLRQIAEHGSKETFCGVLLGRIETWFLLHHDITALSCNNGDPVDELIKIIRQYRQSRNYPNPNFFLNAAEVIEACPKIIDIISNPKQLENFIKGVEKFTPNRVYHDFDKFCETIRIYLEIRNYPARD